MSKKTRLDVLLVERGFFESRQKAQTTIMSGLVFVKGQRVDKPGTAVPNDAEIEVRGNALKYVSRGGLKLEKAMATFPVQLQDAVCGDIGASTGGFTDCMLQNGASKVYSVDVGYGQLAWKLREDPRVVCMERTNARYLTHAEIPDELDFASVDVSFISLNCMSKADERTGEPVLNCCSCSVLAACACTAGAACALDRLFALEAEHLVVRHINTLLSHQEFSRRWKW